jgi:hypothetical protein
MRYFNMEGKSFHINRKEAYFQPSYREMGVSGWGIGSLWMTLIACTGRGKDIYSCQRINNRYKETLFGWLNF